jgi:hypothetical protein
MGPQLVFAQYLFGLSVVEAVRTMRGYEDVGVHLKWPNDLYANLGADQGLKKIGGILVNSTFAGGDFTVIIGDFAYHPLGKILADGARQAAASILQIRAQLPRYGTSSSHTTCTQEVN